MSEADVYKVISKFDKISAGKKPMDDVSQLIEYLERLEISVDILNKTRIGIVLNEFRKKIDDDRIAKRAKHLIKKWKQTMDGGQPASTVEGNRLSRSENGTRKAASQSSPAIMQEAKKAKVEDVKPVKTETPLPPKPAPVPTPPTKTVVDQKPKVKNEVPPSTSVKLPPRDHSLKLPQDDARSRNVTVLANSLKSGDYPEGSQNPDNLAIVIEDAIFEAHAGEKYSSMLRSRVFNLRDKRNPGLRENVLLGNISPKKFAVMTADEMASNEMKKLRDKFTKEAINEHQMAVTEGTPSDMFKCGKCGKNNCTYNQMQTRSADEPMTTFVFCRECGNRWKFC
uniref:Transcription elongation factor S-II n=1 Tax=Panagrolaimus sp. JU765 TaxID=591449 RepID=A0AC34QNT3_9BILA